MFTLRLHVYMSISDRVQHGTFGEKKRGGEGGVGVVVVGLSVLPEILIFCDKTLDPLLLE